MSGIKMNPGTKRKLRVDDYFRPVNSPKRHQPSSRRATRSQADIPATTIETTDSDPIDLEPTQDEIPADFVDIHCGKPEAHGKPPAWSPKRAALNDAVSYYKSHQGSVYSRSKTALGLLIDESVEIRDYFSSEVIITTIGGGKTLDPVTKKMVRSKDQDSNGLNYVALRNAYLEKSPLVVVAGAGNTLFPVKPPSYYNVLDYFWITDMWSEVGQGLKDGEKIAIKQFKMRLEKVNLGSRSWWAPKGASAHDVGEFSIGEFITPSASCRFCRTSSKQLFKEDWTCLNKECEKFFYFKDGIDTKQLEHSDEFLKERTACPNLMRGHPLTPSLPSKKSNDSGSEERFKQGIVCPKCRCCSRRIKWEGWFCENPDCDFTYKVPIKMIAFADVLKENRIHESKSRNCKLHKSIKAFDTTIGDVDIKTYFLPDETDKGGFVGSVTRIRPGEQALQRPGGFNDLYAHVQSSDIKFQRNPAKNSGCRIEELTSHFAVNFGAPYKFGVVVKTTNGFSDAPLPIIESLLRLTWAGKTAVSITNSLIQDKEITANEIAEEFVPYNEELVLAYFEKSKISAHDDGEKELGPNVATLSLGSPSTMTFSPKKGLNIGETHDKTKKLRAAMLTLKLKHGDMVVMHGQHIQSRYLHAVEPTGKHRFALTCRHILPERMPNEEQRQLALVNGKLPDQWSSVRYDGESDQFQAPTGDPVASPTETLAKGEEEA